MTFRAQNAVETQLGWRVLTHGVTSADIVSQIHPEGSVARVRSLRLSDMARPKPPGRRKPLKGLYEATHHLPKEGELGPGNPTCEVQLKNEGG